MILFWMSIGHAETPLTLQAAIDHALKNNPSIQASSAAVFSAKGGVIIAHSQTDPTVTVGFGRNFATNQQFFAGFGTFNTEVIGPTLNMGISEQFWTGTNVSVNWSTNRSSSRYQLEDAPLEQENNPYDTRLVLELNQPLLDGFKVSANKYPLFSAQSTLSMAELSLKQTQADTAAQVAQAYWAMHNSHKRFTLATNALELADEEARVVAALVAAGNLADVESTRVEASKISARTDLLLAEQDLENTEEALLVLLGMSLEQSIVLTTEPQLAPPPPTTFADDWTELKQTNIELRLLVEELRIAAVQLDRARHKRLPNLNFTASYTLTGWEDKLGDALNEMIQAELPSHYVGLNANVPLGNRADRGALIQAEADLQQKQARLTGLEQSLERQLRDQRRRIDVLQNQLELTKINVQLAEETLVADRARRDAGRSIEKDVLDAMRAVHDARIQHTSTVTELLLARVELERLKGNLVGQD